VNLGLDRNLYLNAETENGTRNRKALLTLFTELSLMVAL
jgi:hypothetical protein